MPTAFTLPPQIGTPPGRSLPNLLGRGLGFPLRRSDTGGLVVVEGVDLVEQSVREIIYTRAGEGIRAFNIRRGVLYGTRLHRYLFESVDHVRDLVSYEVKRALDVWEPRILVRRVDVSAPADLSTANGRKTVLIDVQYVLRATNRADNLVVPYAMRTAA